MREKILCAIMLVVMTIPGHAEESSDSVDVYSYQSVYTEVTVQGRDTLTSHHVSVIDTGKLTLNGPKGVFIPSDFHVNTGGVLSVNGGMQYAINFFYDASGNRIRRQKKTE
jgi:hypothetical protein